MPMLTATDPALAPYPRRCHERFPTGSPSSSTIMRPNPSTATAPVRSPQSEYGPGSAAQASSNGWSASVAGLIVTAMDAHPAGWRAA